MINPRNYSLIVDNQKYLLSNKNLNEKGDGLIINPLDYNISSTSTVSLSRYFSSQAEATSTTVTSINYCTDFPKYGNFPLYTQYTDPGSLYRSTSTTNHNWKLSMPRFNVNKVVQNLDENATLPDVDYTLVYAISMEDIINFGIYQIKIKLANIQSPIQYCIVSPNQFRLDECSMYPTIDYDHAQTPASEVNIIHTIPESQWQTVINNEIIIDTFDCKSYWENDTGNAPSSASKPSLICTYSESAYSIICPYFNTHLYMKCNNTELNQVDIEIEDIIFKQDFAKFISIPASSFLQTVSTSAGLNIRYTPNGERATTLFDTSALVVPLSTTRVSNTNWTGLYLSQQYNTKKINDKFISYKIQTNNQYLEESSYPYYLGAPPIYWAMSQYLAPVTSDQIEFYT